MSSLWQSLFETVWSGNSACGGGVALLLTDVTCDIIRMDADTTSRKGDHQRLLEQFAKPGAAVLLGTQMIAKGLDFDEVTLVGVINADTMLKLPDFRSAERTFDLIEQVAGRAGRAEKPGAVIVQTYSAQDPAIRRRRATIGNFSWIRSLSCEKGWDTRRLFVWQMFWYGEKTKTR